MKFAFKISRKKKAEGRGWVEGGEKSIFLLCPIKLFSFPFDILQLDMMPIIVHKIQTDGDQNFARPFKACLFCLFRTILEYYYLKNQTGAHQKERSNIFYLSSFLSNYNWRRRPCCASRFNSPSSFGLGHFIFWKEKLQLLNSCRRNLGERFYEVICRPPWCLSWIELGLFFF